MAVEWTRARAEAQDRYNATHFKKMAIALRLVEDADIIEDWKLGQKNGLTNREWLRSLYEGKDATPSGLCEIEKVEKLLWEYHIPPQTIKAIMDDLK